MALTLASPAFQPGGAIPAEYTCDGSNRSIPLAWSGAPGGTQRFALIVDDPDAPDPAAPRRTFVHWVLYDLPATVTSLPADAARKGLPAGCRSGKNDGGRSGYIAPCPPVGRHRYFCRLYALGSALGDLREPGKAALLKAMEGRVLAQAELMGTYGPRG